MSILINALLCALAASAYHGILIMPGKILAPFHRRLSNGVEWLIGSKFYPVVEFITHSLRECAYCLAGQLGLLHYILTTTPSISFAYVLGAVLQTTAAIYLSALTLKTLQDATEAR